ncbi:MAG: hypothetical protein K0S12_1338 [Bacteroidetes bacterium]|nr:hypothetical protein [Bacteroidota bacterium]
METTFQTAQFKSTTNEKSVKTTSAYEKLISKLEFSYFGIISMTILIGSMVGGIAAMYILKNDAPIWQLGVCMALAMGNNVAAIGQAPTKWVVNLFIANVLVNAVLAIANFS